MWRDDAEAREKSRIRAQGKQGDEMQNEGTHLYPCLTEVPKSRNPFRPDPDLDSAHHLLSQGPTESCRAFLARLSAEFDRHSDLQCEHMGATHLKGHEAHLKEQFLRRMKPEAAVGVKTTCISWKTASLADIIQRAEHGEERLSEKERLLTKESWKTLSPPCIKPWHSSRGRGRGRGSGHTTQHRLSQTQPDYEKIM